MVNSFYILSALFIYSYLKKNLGRVRFNFGLLYVQIYAFRLLHIDSIYLKLKCEEN